MKRGVAIPLLALAALALLYLGAVVAVVAGAPASPLERGLEARDLPVERALCSTLPDLRASPGPVALVVLVAPGELPDAEREALRAHVERGGHLWVLSPAPSARALWDGALRAHAFPGFVYASNGSAPALALADAGLLSASGFLALDADPEAYDPVLTADERAFRDTNGNRRLDTGEPGGPFTVAAQADVGAGRVVVVGVEDASLLPDAFSTALARGLPEGRVVVVDSALAPAWTAPGLGVLALAGLPAGSLLAAALLVLAGGAALLLVLTRGEDAAEATEAPALRLSDAYLARLRERAGPEDERVLQTLQGDTAP